MEPFKTIEPLLFTKENIELYLLSVEKKFQISILFACECGSRAQGLSTQFSDYDLRGIYKNSKSPEKEPKLAKLLDASTTIIEKCFYDDKKTIKIDLKLFFVDYYLQCLTTLQPIPTHWLKSPVVYRNSAPFLIDCFLQEMSPSFEELKKRLERDLDILQKEKNERPTKRVLNMIICALWLLYIFSTNSYSSMNFQETLLELKKIHFSKFPFDKIEELILKLHDLKKKGGGPFIVEEWLCQFVRDILVFEKYYSSTFTRKSLPQKTLQLIFLLLYP